MFITDSIYFQTGEFFYSAQRSATQQPGEMVVDQAGDSSLESPLLQQVWTIILGKHYLESPSLFSCFFLKISLFSFQEMVTDPSKQVKLGFLSGLIPKQKAMAFERILFRATRGNMLLRQESVDETVTDPQSGEKVTTFLSHQLLSINLGVNSEHST